MPYITTAERIGMEKGIKEGLKKGKIENAREDIVEVLENRFGGVPKGLREKIKGVEDEKILSSLLKWRI